MYSLLLNGNLIELEDKTAFGLTFQNIDLKKGTQITNTFSSSIKIPLTPKNVNVLGFVNIATWNTNNKINETYTAVILIDGLELSKGKFKINKATQTHAEGYFYEEKKDLVINLQDFKLKQAYNSSDLINISSETNPETALEVLPAVKEVSLLHQIIQNKGYTVNYLNNSIVNDTAILFNKYNVSNYPRVSVNISYYQDDATNPKIDDGTRGFYTVPFNKNPTEIPAGEFIFRLKLKLQFTVEVNYWSVYSGNKRIHHSTTWSPSEEINLDKLYWGVGDVEIRFSSPERYYYNGFVPLERTIEIVELNYEATASGEDLPDVNQKDFLTYFINRNFYSFEIEQNQVNIFKNQDVLNGVFGQVDWSDKLVEVQEINYDNKAKKTNTFSFANETEAIEVNGSRYNGEEKIYNSSFRNYPERSELLYNDNEVMKSREIKDTIVKISNPQTKSIKKFRNTPDNVEVQKTVYKMSKFPTSEVKEHYQSYFQLLQNYKLINATFNLNLIDIKELDLKKLVFVQEIGKCYINKISNYKEGALTKVELLKVN